MKESVPTVQPVLLHYLILLMYSEGVAVDEGSSKIFGELETRYILGFGNTINYVSVNCYARTATDSTHLNWLTFRA